LGRPGATDVSDSGIVVVTGAGGFIGRALVAHFESTGRPYRAIVRQHDAEPPPKPNVHPVRDLAAASDAELDALVAGTRAIVHLAGRAHVLDETDPDPSAAYASANVAATARLARAAVRAGVERFVFASSIKVNGESSVPGRPFKPGDPPSPRDDYARSKRDGERELAATCNGTSMAPVVLRLPLVYGPGVKGNFATLIDEVARARPLPLARIRNRRSLLFVGNLVEAIDAALDARPTPTGVHFVTDAESVSVPTLVTAVGNALNIPVRLQSIPVRLLVFAGQVSGRRTLVERLVGTLEADPTSFIDATGWRPRHALADGIKATARWWRMRHSI
jgi:nucleoside-diphosphate-sugar epimerase